MAEAEAEAESPHLEIISPPGLLGLKEEARCNVVEILEKPESRSSDSSFTEALRFYTARELPQTEPMCPLQRVKSVVLLSSSLALLNSAENMKMNLIHC